MTDNLTDEEMREDMASRNTGDHQCGEQPGPTEGATAALAGVLPDVLDGHWTTADGREMAERYAIQPRRTLGFADHTDFSLANAIYLADRNSLDLIVLQTAAKDRIRWLSAQLAVSSDCLTIANRDLGKVYDENQALLARASNAEAELGLIRQMAAASVKWDEENLAAVPADLPSEHNISVKKYWHDRSKISRSWQAFCGDPIHHPGRKNLTPDGGEAVHEQVRQPIRDELEERLQAAEARAIAAEAENARLKVDLKVIGDASVKSERMFGGSMSEVTRVFEHITRVSRLHEARTLTPSTQEADRG